MIKTTTIEFNKGDAPLFYVKDIDSENSITKRTPIDGYTPNENVSCLKCKFYNTKTHHNDGGYSPTIETCTHEENTHYTYDYEGKHKHFIWEPQSKNDKLDCELWEQKKSVMQKIKIRLGID